MKRTGAALGIAVALLAACGGSDTGSTEATVTAAVTTAAEGTSATIGSTSPRTTADGPFVTDATVSDTEPSTTASGAATVLDGAGLPTPEPAPLPLAFENTSQIGLLEIPAVGVSQALFEGVTLKTLDNGPGHWPGTALPGERGNVVIAGHRVSQTHPFRDLDLLDKGDEVILSTSQGRHVYLVQKVEIVNADALWIIKQTPSKTATLFACHPKGSTAKRIVAFLTYAPERSKPAA